MPPNRIACTVGVPILVAALTVAGIGCHRRPSTAPQSVSAKHTTKRSENIGLDVGQVAPEIDAEDLDGKRFKLSDYRGKVVVLDFWGNW